MELTLQEMFEEDEADAIDWQGQIVRSVIRFPVEDNSRIRLRRLGSSRDRAQALKLSVNSGQLVVVDNGFADQSLSIWSHTAPEEVELRVDGRRATRLDVWNAWSLDGVDNSWLGNAGIIIQDHAGGHTLQCSDGVGDPDFADLAIWIGLQ